MNNQKNGDIQIILKEKEVVKKYHCENFTSDRVKKRFLRELKAYKYFNSLKISFVPRLISYDELSCSLTLEKIDGVTLNDLIEAGDINENEIISALIRVDRYLYVNKINYMHSSIKDIMVSGNEKNIYIIDFEYTYLNEYFQQILYDCMFGSRMMRVKNEIGRDKFLKEIIQRRHEFESYYFRKTRNIMISVLGIMRKKD